MPRATCRCGQSLTVPSDGTERIICPNCGAKVRIRRPNSQPSASTEEDGFVRFNCPCGRRLKVGSTNGAKPTHGKCPDCGRVVPVPATSLPARDPEALTEELSATDANTIGEWSKRHLEAQAGRPLIAPTPAADSPWKAESGLRICPGCGKPVHLGASICRDCGSPVPKR